MPDETKDNQFVVGKTEKTLASLTTQDETKMPTGAPITGYAKNNIFEENISNGTMEYPRMNTPYQGRAVPGTGGQAVQRAGMNIGPGGVIQDAAIITPAAHTLRPLDMLHAEGDPVKNGDYFVKRKEDHFIRDISQGIQGEATKGAYMNPDAEVKKIGYVDKSPDPNEVAVFSGATTHVNPFDDPVKKEIMQNGGLSRYLEETARAKELGTYSKPPISPIHPFHRMNSKENPHTADEAIFKTYNRTKLPIADIEWRKGFRHIFITRPECYLMGGSGASADFCEQAVNDEDFGSAITRMPHIIKLLSPWYVSGSLTDDILDANWNFLLSNRVQGLSVAATSMTINDSVGKSIEGFTITPAMHVESRQGSTLDLTFRDTKNLEVYEYLRLLMLYMYKRKKGIFIPPYNGYQIQNDFIKDIPESGNPLTGAQYTRYHPYDRALEYCSSLYDIVTNESGTKILYWCKYYGIYPTSVSPSLSNDNNGPITELTTSATFKYHYRLENTNKVLVEFNHDAGLVDDVGNIKQGTIANSMPFLLREAHDDPVMPKYIGAAGMFTGSPYIVMAKTQTDPFSRSTPIYTPNLRFTNLKDLDLNGNINIGITNVKVDQPTKNVISYT
jgi:hypothetical protein